MQTFKKNITRNGKLSATSIVYYKYARHHFLLSLVNQYFKERMKIVKITLISIGVVIILGIIGVISWELNPLGPASDALAAMKSNTNVTVHDKGNFIAFTPTQIKLKTGFIFYPGGHVDYRSYAPIAQEIARRGYMVSIVRMPLSLAVFGINTATK